MSTAWEDIGVQTVLDIGNRKADYMYEEQQLVETEFEGATAYIAVLERALLELGIEIHDNGAVSPVTPRNPTEGTPA